MKIAQADRAILRPLAERVAQIAALPQHAETAAEWTRLNGLGQGKPMVWIDEIPWHEVDIHGDLRLQTTSEFCQALERTLRRTIYQWEHARVDMVVEPSFPCFLAIRDTGFGIRADVDCVVHDRQSSVLSWRFHSQIDCEKDLEKIQTPVVTHDKERTELYYQKLVDLFGDILTIEKRGIVHTWFAPWDELVRWWDVEKLLLDLIARPELVHQAIDRLLDAHLSRLEQWRELNLLALTDGNYRVGSGGPGYSEELPHPGFDPQRVRTEDQWGFATAQIFSAVSPEMHEEFALRYETRWLEQFGLNYYGCCEPLHGKLDALMSLPNLRKISMSPWADAEIAADKIGDRYVFSHKPNPAVFVTDAWDLGPAQASLEAVLEQTRGCVVEVIMKDITTVRHQPQRLWEWATMAAELTARYA